MAQRSPSVRKQAERFPTLTRMAVTLHVNGVEHKLMVAPWTTLLDVLRLHLDLTGTKKGCDHRLRGARLVTATETAEGRRWAEAKIKAVTGGDKIAARFMRQDFFEFVPSFKLIISGNYMPGLRSVDEAMRRRLHVVPFSVTIPAAERDDTLLKTLKAEWPGILSWMIQGCREWQRSGLQPPQAVRNATAAYLQGEDSIASWIDERCQLDPQAWETVADLYVSWFAWATHAGEPGGSKKNFVQNLQARGYRPYRTHAGRGFYGLRL
jgi:putative DNA primase/helicase